MQSVSSRIELMSLCQFPTTITITPLVNVQLGLNFVISFQIKLVKHNAVEAAKNNRWARDEDAIDYNIINRMFKKFSSCCTNVNNQAMSVWPKFVDSEAVLEAIAENPVSVAYHIPGWIFTFTITAKAIGVAE